MENSNKPNSYQIEDPINKGEVIVTWIMTHACQENCGYCISPTKTDELSTEIEHFTIQNKLIKDGLTKMRYIGGEPLIIKHFPKLIASAYDSGVNTRLSTNGILLVANKFDKIKPFINSIALPFESLNDEINTQIRGNRLHRRIISSRIDMIQDAGNIGILINTCVHKENIDELEALGGFLSEKKVNHWKLRRFNSSSGRGAIPNKDRFDITDEAFFQKVDLLKRTYPDLKIDGRLPSKLETRLMVSPQGLLYRMVGSDEENVHYGKVTDRKINVGIISVRDRCD